MEHDTIATTPTGASSQQDSPSPKEAAQVAAGEAKAVAQDAKQHATRIAGDATQQLRGEAAQRLTRLGETMRQTGEQVRGMAEGQAPPPGVTADLVRQVGDWTQRTGSQLASGDLDRVLSDLRSFARRRPGVFLFASMAAGFAAGRVLRNADLGSVVSQQSGNGQQGFEQLASQSGQPSTAAYSSTGASPTAPSSDSGREFDDALRR
jgi:hypothetical protein